MNAHEHGKKLSRLVSGTIGVLAVVAASVLGLHSWADVLATKAAAGSSTQQAPGTITPGSDDGGSGDGGSGDGGSNDDGPSGSVQQAPQTQNVFPVAPGNGQSPNATTNGS